MTVTQRHVRGQQVNCCQVPCQSPLGASRLLPRPGNPSAQSWPLSTACLEGWAGTQLWHSPGSNLTSRRQSTRVARRLFLKGRDAKWLTAEAHSRRSSISSDRSLWEVPGRETERHCRVSRGNRSLHLSFELGCEMNQR